jgi:hypothetical protein
MTCVNKEALVQGLEEDKECSVVLSRGTLQRAQDRSAGRASKWAC